MLTCGIILIGRESRAYVGLASICSGMFAIVYAFRKPIKDDFEDKLQLTSLLVIFLNLGIGVILKIPKESVPSDVDQYVDSLLVNILVVGANVLVIVLVVGMLIFIDTLFPCFPVFLPSFLDFLPTPKSPSFLISSFFLPSSFPSFVSSSPPFSYASIYSFFHSFLPTFLHRLVAPFLPFSFPIFSPLYIQSSCLFIC